MTGKTHKAIGGAVGVALVLYAVKVEQPAYALGVLTSQFGAMLPDIDHHNSKIGKTRKNMFAAIKNMALVAILVAATLVSLSFLLPVINILRNIAIVTLVISLFIIVALSDGFKKKFPFLTKHRGIMHTLCIPAVIFVCASNVENIFPRAVLLGLGLGYCSHLLADSLTVMGSPLVWPISQMDISFAPIRTGTILEYIAGAVLSVILVVYGYILAEDSSKAIWMFSLLVIAGGEAITEKVVVTLKRVFKLKVKKYVICLVFAVIFIIAYFMSSRSTKVVTACLFIGSIKSLFKKIGEK